MRNGGHVKNNEYEIIFNSLYEKFADQADDRCIVDAWRDLKSPMHAARAALADFREEHEG